MCSHSAVVPDFFTPIRKKYGKQRNVSFSFQHGFLYLGSKVYLGCKKKTKPCQYDFGRETVSLYAARQYTFYGNKVISFAVVSLEIHV